MALTNEEMKKLAAEYGVPATISNPSVLVKGEIMFLPDTLQELLYGLYALIGVHFRKEEDIQLPAFDAAPPEVTQAVLERMEALAGHTHEHVH